MNKEEQRVLRRINHLAFGLDFEKVILDKKELKIIIDIVAKQFKVIDEMAKKLNQHGFFCVDPVKEYDVNSELYLKAKTTEEIKQYFYRKVEGDEGF